MSVEPAAVLNGLASYAIGEGDPILLMPSPHAFTTTATAESPLASVLCGLGKRVISFDPPGAYRSTRPARVSMTEMLDCASETLAELGIAGPLVVAGHSMAGLCALAYTLAHPEQVTKLLLIGTLAWGSAAQRYRGMPLNWRITDPRFWRFVVNGMLLAAGKGSLATQKQVLQLMSSASYVDQTLAPEIRIEPEDWRRPAPARTNWPNVARHMDYRARLGEVRACTLICAGRFDPQAPLGCSQELARGIGSSRLVIFEHSGHYPFREEPGRFTQEVSGFLDTPPGASLLRGYSP